MFASKHIEQMPDHRDVFLSTMMTRHDETDDFVPLGGGREPRVTLWFITSTIRSRRDARVHGSNVETPGDTHHFVEILNLAVERIPIKF
jgi:hypothetical protein